MLAGDVRGYQPIALHYRFNLTTTCPDYSCLPFENLNYAGMSGIN
jgi:hypothetical protein